MKSLFIFLFIINQVNAAKNKEVDIYLMGMKEKEDEQMLLNSQIFETCKTNLESFQKDTETTDSSKQTYLQKLEECVKQQITQSQSGNVSEAKLKELSKSLDLASYNKEASKNAKSIQEYLSNRIHKAIYGETKVSDSEIEKIKKAKLVDHELFYQMYSEQVGKNVLLTTANYCLENFGYKKPTSFIYITGISDKSSVKQEFSSLEKVIKDKTNDKTSLYSDRYELDMTLLDNAVSAKAVNTSILGASPISYKVQDPNDPNKHDSVYGFDWKKHSDINEYELCSAQNESRCDEVFKDENGKIRPYRPQRIVTLLKDAEFILAKNDKEKNLIKDRYNTCVLNIIPKMCELYKCNNSYNQNSPDDIKQSCIDTFGITPKAAQVQSNDISLDTEKKKGYIACNVMARLEEYRLILKGVKDIQDENKTYLASNKMNGILTEDGNVFNKAGDVNKILTISSKEMKEIGSIKSGKEDALALREECLDEKNPGNEIDGFVFKQGALENEKCAPLFAKTNKAEYETIVLDTEAKTKLLEKGLEDLNSEEAIKKYLEEAGLYEKYKDKLDSLTPDEMKSLVMADFKNQKQALIDSLAAKFDKDKQIKVSDDQTVLDTNKDIENEIATQTFEDMQNYQERVDTLFEYTNVVSSYLEMENKTTNEKMRNTVTLQVEAEYKSDDTNEIIQDYYNEGEASSSSEAVQYDQFLNTILGYKTKEDPKT